MITESEFQNICVELCSRTLLQLDCIKPHKERIKVMANMYSTLAYLIFDCDEEKRKSWLKEMRGETEDEQEKE